MLHSGLREISYLFFIFFIYHHFYHFIIDKIYIAAVNLNDWKNTHQMHVIAIWPKLYSAILYNNAIHHAQY